MAPITPTVPAKRALPSKESNLFKDLLNHYESRQLKKGLKTADQILKKFPEHGETLSMKGLVLTHMGRREEGLELVKKGIRLDLTSHICWHVFGLIQKGEKNYEEALKSYTQALRFDKENLNLLQDAANLQTQLRQYETLQETRYLILKLRPNVRRNWIALAIAYHLNGNLADARVILDHYQLILKNIPDYDVEHSEVLLYHIRILEDLGENADAMSLLDTNAKSRAIVDRMAIMEYRARLHSKLNQPDEAAHSWRALIEHNSENNDYYRGYLSAKNITLDSVTEENRSDALAILREWADQLPKASAPRRIALNIATGDDFRNLARAYISNGLTKGVPSLFVDLKALYTDSSKQQAIEDIVLDLKNIYELSSTTSHPNSDSEQPTTYLWTLYYLAQHYSHLQRLAPALATLDTAIAHTPTLPELYSCKARVLKRAGDPFGAALSIENARKLDGQDRFLNTKSGKYHLRAGLLDEASDIFGHFTKKDAPSPGSDLEDMQSLLFMIEEADAHNRLGRIGLSLKRYLAVQKVFDDVFFDQYDFHSYSIRRFTINIYLNLITWEDQLRSQPAYVKSAVEASKIYVRLHDDPKLAASSSTTGNLTGAEKKAQKKAKKAANKTQDDPKKAAVTSTNEDKGLEPGPSKDDDPEGIKALSVTDPLEQAWKLLKPFASQAKNSLDVWISIYDVAVRRQKYLQASKALLQARSIERDNPEVHVRIIDFKQRVSALPQAPPEPVRSALSSSLSLLLPTELALDTFNSQYLQRHSTSAKALLAAAKASYQLNAPPNEIEDVVFSILAPEKNGESSARGRIDIDVKTALAALTFLDGIKSPRGDEFRIACDSYFELATVFKIPEEIARLRAEARNGSDGNELPADKDKREVIS